MTLYRNPRNFIPKTELAARERREHKAGRADPERRRPSDCSRANHSAFPPFAFFVFCCGNSIQERLGLYSAANDSPDRAGGWQRHWSRRLGSLKSDAGG